MDANLEQRVRERAFQLWLGEGMPNGRDLDCWVAAECEVKGSFASPGPGEAPARVMPKPKRARTAKARK